jgi:uncharacterized membrane protein
MILYNTLMGVCAGGGMILVANMLRKLSLGRQIEGAGYGPALLLLGLPLTILAGAMTLTWPLTVNPAINIVFGEPALMLGLLLTVAGLFLTKFALSSAQEHYPNKVTVSVDVLKPVRWVIFFVGLILASVASAIASYDLVGDAPPNEPITGQFTGWENTFFFVIYLLAAVGCLLTPWLRSTYYWVNRMVVACWMVSGVAFLVFSVLNYRTHPGLLVNIERGTSHDW